MSPILEIHGNLAEQATFNAGGVPSVDRRANILEIVETFLASQIPNKKTARIIKHLAEVADIKKRISPHALRHTFAFSSYLYCRNLMAVSKLLGHATITTTQRYVQHLDQLDLRKAIPAFLAGGKGPAVLPTVKNPK